MGKRGKIGRALPIHPNRVLRQAIMTGLSTSLYIQRSIVSRTTRHLYESSRKIWSDAKSEYKNSIKEGNPDFEIIVKAERNIRRNTLFILFEIAAAYGSTEVSRTRSHHEKIGPVNQRFNTVGSVMREFAAALYPFPEIFIDKEKTKLSRGYRESSFCHQITPIHSTPELDFVDICRIHLRVIAVQCFIYGVGISDTRRYANLFLLKMKPYLDFIYTEHLTGEQGFREASIQILREIKEMISKAYCIRSGITETVTKQLSREITIDFDTDFFLDQIEEAREVGIPKLFLKELERISEGGSVVESSSMSESDYLKHSGKSNPCITSADVRHLWTIAKKKGAKIGSQVHQYLLSGFNRFHSAIQAINNDTIGKMDGYRLCTELPLDTAIGKGRADLVLFKRTLTSDALNVLWKPVFIVEVKTKTGFDWDFEPERKFSESRKRYSLEQRVVPRFIIRRRKLTKSEWEDIVKSEQSQSHSVQVNTYAETLSELFCERNPDQKVVPRTAVLILDTAEDIVSLRKAIRKILIQVYEKGEQTHSDSTFTISLNKLEIHAVIKLSKKNTDAFSKSPHVKRQWIQPFNPLPNPLPEGNFILYLTARHRGAGGRSSAWIAGYCDLFERYAMRESKDILWLDLANEFVHERIVETRLRIISHQESDKQHISIIRQAKRVIKSIKYLPLVNKIFQYLFEEKNFNLDLNQHIPTRIIISGWNRIESSIPDSHRMKLKKLQAKLMRQLDLKQIEVIWIDTPNHSPEGSWIYGQNSLIPFYPDSPYFGNVSKIIWNLPTPPRHTVFSNTWKFPFPSYNPTYDDVRIIIRHEPDNVECSLIHIIPLLEWSRRFQNKIVRRATSISYRYQEEIPKKSIRTRMKNLAYDLVRYITNLYENQFDPEELVSKKQQSIKVELSPIKRTGVTSPPNILQRLRYRPKLASSGLAWKPLSAKINSQRYYRKPRRNRTAIRPLPSRRLKKKSSRQSIQYGIRIRFIQFDDFLEIIIMEDSYNPSRFLIGCFTKSISSGLVWTLNEWNIIREIFQSEKEGVETNQILIRSINGSQRLWEYNQSTESWAIKGKVKIIRGYGAKVGRIVGMGLEQIKCDEVVHNQFETKDIGVDALQLIDYLVERAKQYTSVGIELRELDGKCVVCFEETAGETIYKAKIEYTADLVKLLRWTIRDHPFHISSGLSLYWDRFRDIEYGPFEGVRPLVETNVFKETNRSIPTKVSELCLDGQDTIIVKIIHYDEDCPIVLKKSEEHGKCWGVFSEASIPNLSNLDRRYTGHSVYALLSTKLLHIGTKKFPIEIENPGMNFPADYVYREDRWIRRIFRENGLRMNQVIPGTFLKDEKWRVSFNVRKKKITWDAISTISGIHLSWIQRSFQLLPSWNLTEATDAFLNFVTQFISEDKIKDYITLRKSIENALFAQGYHDASPRCKLIVEQDELKIEIRVVREIDELVYERVVLEVNPNSSIEDFQNILYYRLEDGDLSVYNITNEEAFFEQIENIFEQIEEDEASEEDNQEEQDYVTELIQVIEEYRNELLAGEDVGIYYAQSLVQLAQYRFENDRSENVYHLVEEALDILRDTPSRNLVWHRVSSITKLLQVRLLVTQKSKPDMARISVILSEISNHLKMKGIGAELQKEFDSLLELLH
ncbi:MAG: hypothetical protein GF411_19700 [Candidatus Lokiarchaeota archaeon]|nr:hypothetical protein [Candidatus Lokiarchaeota archaeon]